MSDLCNAARRFFGPGLGVNEFELAQLSAIKRSWLAFRLALRTDPDAPAPPLLGE